MLYKDILSQLDGSPWSVYKTDLANSDGTSIFNTGAVTYLRRPEETELSIYFGDKDGNIYDLNGAGLGDNGSNINVSRETMPIESSRANIMKGYIQYRRLGEMGVSLMFDWDNEYNTTQSDITLKGADNTASDPPYFGGSAYFGGPYFFNKGDEYQDKISRQNFSPAGRSEGFRLTIYTSTTVRFQIDRLALLE